MEICRSRFSIVTHTDVSGERVPLRNGKLICMLVKAIGLKRWQSARISLALSRFSTRTHRAHISASSVGTCTRAEGLYRSWNANRRARETFFLCFNSAKIKSIFCYYTIWEMPIYQCHLWVIARNLIQAPIARKDLWNREWDNATISVKHNCRLPHFTFCYLEKALFWDTGYIMRENTICQWKEGREPGSNLFPHIRGVKKKKDLWYRWFDSDNSMALDRAVLFFRSHPFGVLDSDRILDRNR